MRGIGIIATLCLLPTLASADYCPDADGDGVVGGTDFFAFKHSFNSTSGDANYDPVFDADQNGMVSGIDYFAFKRAMGKVCRKIIYKSSAERYRNEPDISIVYLTWIRDGITYLVDDWPAFTCQVWLWEEPVYLVARDSASIETRRILLERWKPGDPLPDTCTNIMER